MPRSWLSVADGADCHGPDHRRQEPQVGVSPGHSWDLLYPGEGTKDWRRRTCLVEVVAQLTWAHQRESHRRGNLYTYDDRKSHIEVALRQMDCIR